METVGQQFGTENASLFRRITGRLGRITSSTRLIPEVNDLRFMAITSVVLFHLTVHFAAPSGPACAQHGRRTWLYSYLLQGDKGVQLFFAISGFVLALPFARHYLQ